MANLLGYKLSITYLNAVTTNLADSSVNIKLSHAQSLLYAPVF